MRDERAEMRKKKRGNAADTDTVCSPHLMLHLAGAEDKPIPSAVLLTGTQSLWSHTYSLTKIEEKKNQAQNRQCVSFPRFCSQLL